MKVRLIFVPPGGGEADYQLQFELPAIPQTGDYISILRDEEVGYETFIVRRTIWELRYPASQGVSASEHEHGTASTIFVECEFARGAFSSDNHKRACDAYEARGFKVPEHEATAY
ncbi:hypothetical protein J2X53_003454 [Pseudorhodobacter sp. 4114]|nr:hypothetical protein [Pseudorhodobacter sp. 4114]